MPDPFSTLKQNILDEALKLVPFEGWNEGTLQRAAAHAAGDAAAYRRAFPHGVAEAVEFFLSETDAQMVEALAALPLHNMKIRQRIATAVRTRLEILGPHKESFRRAVAIQFMPQNTLWAAKALWRTVDLMWYAAGDTQTDFNHYTKRLLLSKVYGSTVLFWLNDESFDSEDTKAFLDRRIENVMQFQKWKGKLEADVKRWSVPFRPSRTKR